MPLFRPGKPGWRAALSGDVVLAAGLQPVTTWDLLWSEGGSWDGGEHFTVDRPGTYIVLFQLERAGTASASNPIGRISRNDVEEWQGTTPTTAGTITCEITSLIRCEEGDTISCLARLHTTLSATMVADHSYFAGFHAGPDRYT